MNFKLGALGALAIVVDFATVALMLAFLVLGQWLHLKYGIELDLLFVFIIVFTTILWLGMSHLDAFLFRKKPANPGSSTAKLRGVQQDRRATGTD